MLLHQLSGERQVFDEQIQRRVRLHVALINHEGIILSLSFFCQPNTTSSINVQPTPAIITHHCITLSIGLFCAQHTKSVNIQPTPAITTHHCITLSIGLFCAPCTTSINLHQTSSLIIAASITSNSWPALAIQILRAEGRQKCYMY